MASLTKNPIILQSANFINSWFRSNIKDKKTLALFNQLESIDSDLRSIKHLKRQNVEEEYYNFEKRYKEIVGDKNESKKSDISE